MSKSHSPEPVSASEGIEKGVRPTPRNLPIPSLVHVLRVFIKQIQLGCIFRHTLEYVLHEPQHGRGHGRVAWVDLAAEARGEVGVVACGEEVLAPKV